RLHVPVTLALPLRRADDFREKGFRGRIPVQDAVLAAFLVIDDELDRDRGAIRPLRIGRSAAVAAHVALISAGHWQWIVPVVKVSAIGDYAEAGSFGQPIYS